MIERASVDFCSKFCSHVRPLELSCRHTPETRTKRVKSLRGAASALALTFGGSYFIFSFNHLVSTVLADSNDAALGAVMCTLASVFT